MAKMKLALVQFQSVLGDVEASMARALPMIDEAAAAGANMVVFPELFTTGYHLDTVGPRMTELAEPIDGLRCARCRKRPAKTACISWLPSPFCMGFQAFRTTARCSSTPTARCRGRLTRFTCGALERFYFRAGHEFPVFDTEFGKVGIMVCYDMGFPEAARTLALKGAELIVCPSAWCVQDADVWEINAPARALENTVFLGAVNRIGHEGDDLYMHGASMVCGPRGGKIAQLGEEEGILYADLDFDEVRKNRVTSPYLRDRRADAYGEVTRF